MSIMTPTDSCPCMIKMRKHWHTEQTTRTHQNSIISIKCHHHCKSNKEPVNVTDHSFNNTNSIDSVTSVINAARVWTHQSDDNTDTMNLHDNNVEIND